MISCFQSLTIEDERNVMGKINRREISKNVLKKLIMVSDDELLHGICTCVDEPVDIGTLEGVKLDMHKIQHQILKRYGIDE